MRFIVYRVRWNQDPPKKLNVCCWKHFCTLAKTPRISSTSRRSRSCMLVRVFHQLVCWWICMKLYVGILTNIQESFHQYTVCVGMLHTFKFLCSPTYSFTNIQKILHQHNFVFTNIFHQHHYSLQFLLIKYLLGTCSR